MNTMILICAAWDEETKYLKVDQDKIKILHLGIGYLEAALNLEKYLLNLRLEKPQINYLKEISCIYFLGTAGLMSDTDIDWDFPVFSVSQSLISLPNSILHRAYVPKPYAEYHLGIDKNLELEKALSISSLEITMSRDLSREICSAYNSSLVLENMELYGVAKVAHRFGLSIKAILGVTNITGMQAHEQWSSQHQAVSKLLCETLTKSLAKL